MKYEITDKGTRLRIYWPGAKLRSFRSNWYLETDTQWIAIHRDFLTRHPVVFCNAKGENAQACFDFRFAGDAARVAEGIQRAGFQRVGLVSGTVDYDAEELKEVEKTGTCAECNGLGKVTLFSSVVDCSRGCK